MNPKYVAHFNTLRLHITNMQRQEDYKELLERSQKNQSSLSAHKLQPPQTHMGVNEDVGIKAAVGRQSTKRCLYLPPTSNFVTFTLCFAALKPTSTPKMCATESDMLDSDQKGTSTQKGIHTSSQHL